MELCWLQLESSKAVNSKSFFLRFLLWMLLLLDLTLRIYLQQNCFNAMCKTRKEYNTFITNLFRCIARTWHYTRYSSVFSNSNNKINCNYYKLKQYCKILQILQSQETKCSCSHFLEFFLKLTLQTDQNCSRTPNTLI